jgi:hypothetical protein
MEDLGSNMQFLIIKLIITFSVFVYWLKWNRKSPSYELLKIVYWIYGLILGYALSICIEYYVRYSVVSVYLNTDEPLEYVLKIAIPLILISSFFLLSIKHLLDKKEGYLFCISLLAIPVVTGSIIHDLNTWQTSHASEVDANVVQGYVNIDRGGVNKGSSTYNMILNFPPQNKFGLTSSMLIRVSQYKYRLREPWGIPTLKI